MDKERIKLIAFDLDGTLTQHKTSITAENRNVLEKLAKKYRLVMTGAGLCRRIFQQMGQFPVDIVGSYGMQESVYDYEKGDITIIKNTVAPCDRASAQARIAALRLKYGFTEFAGESVEFHSSGCVTFPILGTEARIEDKLAFDPDRTKRRAILSEVQRTFPDYTVFLGGSSSFDMAPAPYNKYFALDRYCKEHGIAHDEVVYVGDDYGIGGNDEPVYRSDFHFIPIDDYRTFPQVMQVLL